MRWAYTAITSLIVIGGGWAGSTKSARATERLTAAQRYLARRADEAGIAHAWKETARGERRLVLRPDRGRGQLAALKHLLGERPNFAQWLTASDVYNPVHAGLHLDDTLYHLRSRGVPTRWSMERWRRGSLDEDTARGLTGFILHLTAADRRVLMQRVESALAASASGTTVGPDVVTALWQPSEASVEAAHSETQRSWFNCVTGIAGAPVGRKGQPLQRLLGLGHVPLRDLMEPSALSHLLANEASARRVPAIVVYSGGLEP